MSSCIIAASAGCTCSQTGPSFKRNQSGRNAGVHDGLCCVEYAAQTAWSRKSPASAQSGVRPRSLFESRLSWYGNAGEKSVSAVHVERCERDSAVAARSWARSKIAGRNRLSKRLWNNHLDAAEWQHSEPKSKNWRWVVAVRLGKDRRAGQGQSHWVGGIDPSRKAGRACLVVYGLERR